jgi:hypothetical protein
MPALDHKEFKDLYPLKVIKSRKDYEKALKSMETVFDETNGPLAVSIFIKNEKAQPHCDLAGPKLKNYDTNGLSIRIPSIC